MILRRHIARLLVIAALALTAVGLPLTTTAQTATTAGAAGQPFVVEYYYKVKWGYADEFIALFKKNHYPLLQKQVEMGIMMKVSAVTPRYHTTEDGRWDYRVTIAFKDAATADDDSGEKALIMQLYPDQATYKKEEQRRFEILEAHWDLPIKDLDLNAH